MRIFDILGCNAVVRSNLGCEATVAFHPESGFRSPTNVKISVLLLAQGRLQ